MQPAPTHRLYSPHHFFNYPFTLVSLPKRHFFSRPIQQPAAYEVYCPLSCKKVKIGAIKDKQKEGLEFNTTAARWVSTYLNQDIKHLINKHAPIKKDKKQAKGNGWSFWVQVSDKGNYAIFNPYCTVPDDPMSLYSFNPIPQVSKYVDIENKFTQVEGSQNIEQINVNGKIVYLHSNQKGVFLGTNKHFDDSPEGMITLTHPQRQNYILRLKVADAVQRIFQGKNYCLKQLQYTIKSEEPNSLPNQGVLWVKWNLDQIYEKLYFWLHLEQQLRAKLMNNQSLQTLNKYYPFHPRLYSTFSRLASFINYGQSKFDTLQLAKLGFYNRSDILKDLAFVEYPEIPIPSAQNPAYHSALDLRKKLFSFSRIQRGLPFPNIPLQATLSSLLPQTVSQKQIIFKKQEGEYLFFVDQDFNVSVWSCRLFPVRLLFTNANSQQVSKTNLLINQQELAQFIPNVQKQQAALVSLFEEAVPAQVKEVKPTQIVPDSNMLEQMVAMGYGVNLVKKALIAVKNQSVTIALDMIEQITNEQKQKKVVIDRKAWSCPACTYLNKAQNDICQMCGQLYEIGDHEQKQRQRLQKEAQEERLKKQEEEKLKIQKEKQEQRRKKDQQEAQAQLLLKSKEQVLKNSKLRAFEVIVRQTQPLDSFYLIFVFERQEIGKSFMKVMRVGINRSFFSKFYRIQEKQLVSTVSSLPMKLDFQGFKSIAQNRTDAIQWGIRLIQPSQGNQWIISSFLQKEIPFNIQSLKVTDKQYFSLQGAQKSHHFKILIKDSIQAAVFELQYIEKLQLVQSYLQKRLDLQRAHQQEIYQITPGQQLPLDDQVTQVHVQILEHLPSNVWKSRQSEPKILTPIIRQTSQVVISDFIPLTIENYQGSVFSGKNFSTTLLEHSPALYISNYPTVNFTFQHLGGKQMYLERAVIASSSKRLQKIYSVFEGLIFTANEPTWFHLAKKRFGKFTKQDYDNWVSSKKAKYDARQFWQPVAFFQIENETEIEFDFKRSAKYVFLLPTTIKGLTQKTKNEVYAIKLDFFGVKGRLQQEKIAQSYTSMFKNEGVSTCKVNIMAVSGTQHVPIDSSLIVQRQLSHVNSYNFLHENLGIFEKIPVSVTSIFSYRLKTGSQSKVLSVNSDFAKRISVRVGREVAEQLPKTQDVQSFQELVKVQKDFTSAQLKKIIQSLDCQQLLRLILSSQKQCSQYESLISKIQSSIYYQQQILVKAIHLLPLLCQEQIVVTEPGFKYFCTIYQKFLTIQPEKSYAANSQALKRLTQFVSLKRNKNYNVLRQKYAIDDLVLEPYLFSKDYYKLVHPNQIQQENKPPESTQPKGPVNNTNWIEQISPYSYRQYIDLSQTKTVSSIKLYVPKINNSIRSHKMQVQIWSVQDSGDNLLYSRYFHEDTLVQLGVNGFKDTQIYKGQRLNCLGIHDINQQARILKIQVNFLLATSQPNIKYKQVAEKYWLIPLVQTSPGTKLTKQDTVLKLLQSFPKQHKHYYNFQRLPPCKYYTQGTKSIFQVHEFPVIENVIVQRQSNQLVDKITTNIMDQNIVRQCVKSIRIKNYQFNRKGIDFAYSYVIFLMGINKKFAQNHHVSVDLLLSLFDTFVVYQGGPIMKTTCTFLQQNYKRLSNIQKTAFIDSVIKKYLLKISQLSQLKISQRYSPLKILEKIQDLELPMANIFQMIQKISSKSLKIVLVKLVSAAINKAGIKNLELFDVQSGKMQGNLGLLDLINITFMNCLWILDNVQGIRQQALAGSIDLFLKLLSGPPNPFTQEQCNKTAKQFLQRIDDQLIWKLVFLSLKLRSESLKQRMNKLFGIITANLSDSFGKSINLMLQQIIQKKPDSIYMKINESVSEELWMSHLQTTLQLIGFTKDSFYLDDATALRLLQLPLTPILWSLVLNVIPRNDKILVSIIRNFPQKYYNSLGKEITRFCEPLAGIRSLNTSFINWLDLVREIRIEGKSIFELFMQQLEKSSYGGRDGLAMATVGEVKQLQITCQFAKLALEQSDVFKNQLTSKNLKTLITWYFLNQTTQKGASPATQKILFLSQSVKNIFMKIGKNDQTLKLAIQCLLQVHKESEVIQRKCQEKRVPLHAAMTLSRRFNKCFEELLAVFMNSDGLCSYFAFDLGGLEQILRTMDIAKKQQTARYLSCTPDEELLISQKLIMNKPSNEPVQVAGKELQQLKQEEFASNVKLMNCNVAGLSASNTDWTAYKKGNKNKVIMLPMIQPSVYHEHPLYVELTKTAQVRSIKIGFPAVSYESSDKLIATPSGVVIQGSVDGVIFEPFGEMDYIQDDAYVTNGVQVWALNCLKISNLKGVGQSVNSLGVHRARYLKITVKRPIITFIEGQYSQLNGKNFQTLGVSISFLSVTGDDCSKLTTSLFQSIRQTSKRSSLKVLSVLLSQGNSLTMRRISNDQNFSKLVQQNFKRMTDYMVKYAQVMPNVIHLMGAGNRVLGDWIVQYFLRQGGGELQAKIINQIITSTPDKAFSRLSLFLKSILGKLTQISQQAQIQSGLLYTKEIHFIQSFCKTLEQCCELGITPGQLECSTEDIARIIDLYDRKHSSPEIKSLIKLLVYLLYMRAPLKLKGAVVTESMNVVWHSCSDAKPHFYSLMTGLLVDKRAQNWLRADSYTKVDQLITTVYGSIAVNQLRNLKLQLALLSLVSNHEPTYLKTKRVHEQLYNKLKGVIHHDTEIIDSTLRIIRNVVLGDDQQERKMAELLYQDVGLLVHRRDPLFQQLFVGVLGLQAEVMIHISGLDLNSTKKQQGIPSKYLTKKQQKMLLQRVGKRQKCTLLGELTGKIKAQQQQLFMKAFGCSSMLVIVRFKVGNTNHTCAVYLPAASKRNEDGDYFWQELINYESSGFIALLQEPQPHIITCGQDVMLANIYGGDQQQQNAAVFYDDSDELMFFTFSTQEPSTPRINLTRYKDKLPSHLTSCTLDADYQPYSFQGVQFWQMKQSGHVNVADSKIGSLLSKSNQARPPFSYYRHSPIYIFPANVTLQKFVGMLGLKGTCGYKQKTIDATKLLSQLQKQASDFIVDLQINSQEERDQEEIGYIPVMKIFSKFSGLGGVKEVLRLGAESIKDWKNASMKKNFEHYMQQLKSFINLPNFFNLFIKNQQYVTLLFEVAAGLPDNESSTRNWQEQYVSNFRFIYKIVSDIFKYDRSPVLRNMDMYADFVQVILDKLSEITKQAPRILKEDQIKQEENEIGQLKLAQKKSDDRKRKKKGTGYGADNQNNSKWSASEWLQARKNVSQQTLRVVAIIVSFLDCEVPLKDEQLTDIIKESCLLPLLESVLRSGSLLDISKQSQLFKAYLQIVRLLSSHPSTIDCILDLQSKYKPQQSQSILSLLKKLNGNAQIFIQCLNSGKTQSAGNELAQGIAIDIQKTHGIVAKAVRNFNKKGKAMTLKELNSMSLPLAYRFLLAGLRFGYVDLKEAGAYSHAHSGSISTALPSTSKILRLSQELADLSSSLPCEDTNAIFVRCDKSRIDVINILMMGSRDTPYSNGAFNFDVYCDDSYPNNPPKMLITTTGHGKIRFNPNLYSCGKVCLSLLGTWRGSASQNWDPKVSTLLQLFISTQGITMSQDVYFNQPGFQGEQGTQQGQRKNEAYSNIVRLGNIRYAMIQQLKKPAKGFQQVIKRHFYIKRKVILEQCERWIQYAQKRQASYNGLVNDHNSQWCSDLKQTKTKYKELLVKQVAQLRQLLENLPPPDLKQPQEKQQFEKEEVKEKTQVVSQAVKLEEVDVTYDKQASELKVYGENVITDRWSRYIGAMGIQAVKKQSQSHVLLVGLKPLGLQIAKNLVLSGLKRITIVEPDVSEQPSEHFYMSNIGTKSIKECIFKIKELNPYMVVEHLDTIPELSGYNCVISTLQYQTSLEISQKCRQKGIKFVYVQTKGVCGTYFADLGLHQVNDNNGQEPFEGIIKNISTQQEGIVTLLDGVKHPYQDGDYVVLSLVEGMDTIKENMQEKSQAQLFFEQQSNQKANGINNRVFRIKVINWNSFVIGDTRNFGTYKSNGLVRNIKIPKKVEYQPLSVCAKEFDKYLDPNMGIYDFEKMSDNLSIFLCFQTLSKFKQETKSYPKNWSLKDTQIFQKNLQDTASSYKLSEQNLKKLKQFGRKFSPVSQAQLPTIGAYLGGMVSQQVIKALTNKYMPIKQFFTFHLNEMQQEVPEDHEKYQKLAIAAGEPFRNLKIVIGRQGAQKVEQVKTFVIGAGAIGCQLLKNFSMINMGAQGQIVVTDPDHIETSNLSRQFLFRQKHVKKAKSATACATMLQLNSQLKGHVVAKLDKVCQQTQEIYSNQFFKSRTIVVNALDNVRARQYMDKRCVQNKIPLFESGTLGPKGHVQVIVPFKTQNYGSQNDPNEQGQIPHCTLKLFPEEVVHCIQWSRDIFGKLFTLNPKALKKVIDAKSLTVLEGEQRQTAAKMIKYRPQSWDDCIAEAVRKFYIYFRNNVRQLLFTYPLDMKTKEGKPFWQLPKRPPKQINELDDQDDFHRTFIAAYAVLLGKIFDVPTPKDFRTAQGKDKIMQVARKVKVQDFVPNKESSKQIQKQVQKENKQNETQVQEQPSSVAQTISDKVQITQDVLEMKVKAEEFQKDQDSNGHIDLIYAMSNLRSKNYGLKQCTWIEAKLKAGKIMAALSTTTSVVAALQTIQIIKLVVGCKIWRNAFINIAVPYVQITQPGPPARNKIGNSDFSVWQDWSFQCSTLNDLLLQLKEKYEVEGYNVSTLQGKPVYWEVMYKDKEQSKELLLNKKLKDMFNEAQIELNVSMRSLKDQTNYEKVPRVKINIKE